MVKPRTWTEPLKSGSTRGVVLLPNGRKVSKAHDFEYEAELWAEDTLARALKIVDQVAAGDPVAVAAATPPKVTAPSVNAYGEAWHEQRRGKWVDTTADGYQTHLDAIARDKIGRISLSEITVGDVEAWQTRQKDEGVGIPSINARLKVLRMLSRYAVKNRIPGAVDATDGVEALPTTPRKGRVVTKVEENRLLLAAHSPEATCQILLGLDTGLRYEEALALSIDCLVGGGKFIDVTQVVERSRKVRGYLKGKRDRVVPATDRVLAALGPLIEKAEAEGRDLVFSKIDEDGVERPVDYHNWRRDLWYRVTGAAKVNRRSDAKVSPGRLHFHDLRHTYGSRLSAAGVPRSEIAVLMGHADEKTTAIYVHEGTDGHRRRLVLAALNGDTIDDTAAEAAGADLKAV